MTTVSNTEIIEQIDREIVGFERDLKKLLIEAARFPGSDGRTKAINQWRNEIEKRQTERTKFLDLITQAQRARTDKYLAEIKAIEEVEATLENVEKLFIDPTTPSYVSCVTAVYRECLKALGALPARERLAASARLKGIYESVVTPEVAEPSTPASSVENV